MINLIIAFFVKLAVLDQSKMKVHVLLQGRPQKLSIELPYRFCRWH